MSSVVRECRPVVVLTIALVAVPSGVRSVPHLARVISALKWQKRVVARLELRLALIRVPSIKQARRSTTEMSVDAILLANASQISEATSLVFHVLRRLLPQRLHPAM